MRWAIISDVHGNIAALNAVIIDARTQGCTRFACLGDIVGVPVGSEECVGLLRSITATCVRGDYDRYCAVAQSLDQFNPAPIALIRATRTSLSAESKAWLRGLPLIIKLPEFTIVHSTLVQPDLWGCVFDKPAASASMGQQEAQVCFFGHTHVPVAFKKDKMVRGGTYKILKLERNCQYMINPSSVGEPRDDTPPGHASYAVFDTSERKVELKTVQYCRQ